MTGGIFTASWPMSKDIMEDHARIRENVRGNNMDFWSQICVEDREGIVLHTMEM